MGRDAHLPAGKALDTFDRQRLALRVRRLDRFPVMILDALGYVQQSREETAVLFTFLAERYERRSVVITSNLVFSKRDQIFDDPLTTADAIDRVVHHRLIMEFGSDVKSMRPASYARRNGIVPAAAPGASPTACAFLVGVDVPF